MPDSKLDWVSRIKAAEARADAAERRLAEVEKERDYWDRRHKLTKEVLNNTSAEYLKLRDRAERLREALVGIVRHPKYAAFEDLVMMADGALAADQGGEHD